MQTQMQPMKILSEIFRENLKRIRADRGLSCEALANQAGVNPSSISLWENAKRIPTLENVEKLAIALDVDVDELLKEKNKGENNI